MVEADPDELFIGIDLGTTYTAAGIWKNGQVQMLQNVDDGLPTTPSVVAYTAKGEILVGNPAIKQTARNFQNTIYDAKRMIGRRFDDPKMVTESKRWPFNVVEGEFARPMIKLQKIKGEERTLYAEEVQAKVLEKVKKSANTFASREVTKCVITVPAYFNDS